MTTTLTDDRTGTFCGTITRNFFIGHGDVAQQLRGYERGPAHIRINGEHFRYEDYQACTLWGLQRMNRREVALWRIRRALRRKQ